MAILLIIGYCIFLHPVICNIMIVVSDDWCRMTVRPARLLSYAFLYTTSVMCNAIRANCGKVITEIIYKNLYDYPSPTNEKAISSSLPYADTNYNR